MIRPGKIAPHDLDHKMESPGAVNLHINLALFMNFSALIRKYNVPVPRYTSYPTVPLWDNPADLADHWPAVVKRVFDETNTQKGISLYIHLPFCESLCTYCGCFQHITINHAVEGKYIECVLKEWNQYLAIFGEKPQLRELHLGGGTPTFFSPQNLKKLIQGILSASGDRFAREFSFEGHPNSTRLEHLKVLFDLGFRRVSFGVQDFDEKIQRAINRIQPYENVENAIRNAREAGYKSVNFDLVYGLPFQTEEIVEATFRKVLKLRPDRIAYYSYAHVPWKRPGQRGYSEADLPDNELKRKLYEIGRHLLLAEGYQEIGMDHFALPGDDLTRALKSRSLHRNFMGYTVTNTDLLVGLGASSISDAKYAFAQNKKKVKEYQDAILGDGDVLTNGHILSDEDLRTRSVIRDLMCLGETSFDDFSIRDVPRQNRLKLLEMADEGLLAIEDGKLAVTTPGKVFIRNICALFDLRMASSVSEGPRYSKAI